MSPFYYKNKQSTKSHIMEQVRKGNTHNLKVDISYLLNILFQIYV